MHRIAWFCLACCVFARAVNAAGYDDFTRGMSAANVGDYDTAITAFNAAIAAGDLNPSLLAAAYRGRASVFLETHRCEPALSDLDQALARKPGDTAILLLHGTAAACLEKFDIALADDTALIDLKFDSRIYRSRGRLRLNMGDTTGAVADFEAYVKARPNDAYGALWLELARLRQGKLDLHVAADDVSDFAKDEWPAPLLALYAGRSTPKDTLAAAPLGSEKERPGRVCEANYYVAEWLIGHDDAAGGGPLLRSAAETCPLGFIERQQARYELEHRP